MEKIKTFEEACKKLNLDPSKLPEVSALPEEHQQALIAHYKLIIVVQALNGGWIPDWNNSNQYKYFPYFQVKASAKKPNGSGLVFNHCDYWCTFSIVGSRLCFKDWETAKYAGTIFKKLYEEYFLIK